MRGVITLFALLLSMALVGCPDKGTTPGEKTELRRIGWMGDNFFPSEDAIGDSGASPQTIKYVDGHLIMQDSYHKGGRAYRIFSRKIGETGWENISIPEGISYLDIGWIVDNSKAFFGAFGSPRLFELDVARKAWSEIQIRLTDSIQTRRGMFPKEPQTPYGIPFILKFHDSLMISMANIGEEGYTFPEVNLWGSPPDTVWSAKIDSLSETDGWLDYQEFHDTLYVATFGHGVWRLGANRMWERLPPPDYIIWQGDSTPFVRPRAIEVVNDRMYVSFLGGSVFRYDDVTNSWTDVAKCDSGYVCYPKPNDNMALTQYKGRLIASGMTVPVPVWYNDTTGVWTWLSYETWMRAFPTSDYYGPTYDMAVAGDTLYVAHENGIVKLNLADPAVWTADTTDATTIEVPINQGK